MSGLPNIAMADEEMIIIADADGNGVVDGTGSEWAASYSSANAILPQAITKTSFCLAIKPFMQTTFTVHSILQLEAQ